MRVLIAEDDALLREGLAALLRAEGIDVVATLPDADSLYATIEQHDAELAIIDVRMPPTYTEEGLLAAIDVRTRRPGFPILVLSAHVETRYASELLADDAGAVGYLLKERVGAVEDFMSAVARVAGGENVLDPEVVSTLMRRGRSPLTALTARERDVLELVAQGDRNGEIAAKLHVTEPAVNKHIRNIFSKLGLFADDAGHRRVRAVLTYLREQ
ncbi:response regulator [Actinocatenispora comari]|uniref:DNA-binding response regulator n=1 Tax=Actinocatenispora comari TaxID=2807577 RepID=A0A8J4ABY5_9ACTN|nr:response regulator transcription factor [Actinocatenispora comari]GIL28153.1 DNA-binding response regulator [Actinocatenispora comari]